MTGLRYVILSLPTDRRRVQEQSGGIQNDRPPAERKADDVMNNNKGCTKSDQRKTEVMRFSQPFIKDQGIARTRSLFATFTVVVGASHEN